MDTSADIIVASSLIVFAAFFIRSLTGFGSALVSIPLLALLFDLKFAIPLEALFEVGFSILLMNKVYKAINKTILFPVILGALIGSLLGTYILYSFATIFLKRMLGIGIILFALSLLMEKSGNAKKSVSISSNWGFLAGGIGGVFGGLFGTSGPPFVMYLTYKLKQKNVLRASLIGLFAIDYSWRVGIFATTGLLTVDILKFALILTPALILGTILGHKAHFQINEIRYRQIVAAILIISGILLLI
ncbi:MAG: sulfite exporter TauE/SafE family protein [Chloroflexi bacterium]|nr:sulfite exporter TauE/SafE family protein [Chloroflexota bacterium]